MFFFFYHGGHNGFLGAVALFRVGDLPDFVMQVDAMMPGRQDARCTQTSHDENTPDDMWFAVKDKKSFRR